MEYRRSSEALSSLALRHGGCEYGLSSFALSLLYSQACLLRPPTWNTNTGRCRQMVFLDRFFNTHFLLEGGNVGDHYREVATKTGLTVHVVLMLHLVWKRFRWISGKTGIVFSSLHFTLMSARLSLCSKVTFYLAQNDLFTYVQYYSL